MREVAHEQRAGERVEIGGADGGRAFRMDGVKFLLSLPDVSEDCLFEISSKIREAVAEEILIGGLVVPLRLAAGIFSVDKNYDGSSAAVRNSLIYILEKSKNEYNGKTLSVAT
ncbi:MAG: hypothetical protein HUK26_09000, partial [Duodenibacillus sp.]|nr:hypothetical protein [Duodenibacillus sp.]